MEESKFVKFPLLHLPGDLLQEILLACDPEDVLTMEKTCRSICLLSDSKHLWVSLLAKLDYDQAPDVGPHVDLDSLRTKEVKRIVIRALSSYNNWCSPDGPRITREQKVQLGSDLYTVMVLPGCKYIVVQSRNEDFFGVWGITRERILARHLCSRRLDMTMYDCSFLKGGKVVRVAFWRKNKNSPGCIEVVDLDLDRGHASLLFSESIQGVMRVYSLRVREEAVFIWTYRNIVLLNPETGKIARVMVESVAFDMDIVRSTLICLVTVPEGTSSLFVAKLSRIFEHTQDAELTSLKDICEYIHVLPIPHLDVPGFFGPIALSICDPKSWGSTQPCRILLSHFVDANCGGCIISRPADSQFAYVQTHRLYLKESTNGSDIALAYDSSTKHIMLEESLGHGLNFSSPSIAGHWTVRSDIRYDFMLSKLWEDDVRLRPTFEVYDCHPHKEVRMDVERYSGTQVWYSKDGGCEVLHCQFFN